MRLAPAAVLLLALRCAPGVAPQTLLAVAQAESGLDADAVGLGPVALRPAGRAAATALAAALIAAGARPDLGLAQINAGNLPALGLEVADAFDPCRNLDAAARLLQSGYRRARRAGEGEQAALREALSRYNTGDPRRGLRNGYVARVEAAAPAGPAPMARSAAAPPFVIAPLRPEGTAP